MPGVTSRFEGLSVRRNREEGRKYLGIKFKYYGRAVTLARRQEGLWVAGVCRLCTKLAGSAVPA